MKLCRFSNMFRRHKLYHTVKCLMVLLIVSTIYHKTKSSYIRTINKYTSTHETTSESVQYPNKAALAIGPGPGPADNLLITPFCTIPDYANTYEIPVPRDIRKHGVRAVRITITEPNLIQFLINSKEMYRYVPNTTFECCYMFFRNSIINNEMRIFSDTTCATFENASSAYLEHEVIVVFCGYQARCKFIQKIKRLSCFKRAPYMDVYILVKNQSEGRTKGSMRYNVLLLGIESMSRARAYATIPRTLQWLGEHALLDYKAYHKTDDMLWQRLSGKYHLDVPLEYEGSTNSSPQFVWSMFKDAGYFTACGENVPLTGNIQSTGTDHYMRPFFHIRKRFGAKSTTDFSDILDYAENFATSYKNYNFFGTFWLNNVKKNLVNDDELGKFFKRLYASGVLANTFVILHSNEGVRVGDARLPVEAYYDERLPMLFVWSPPNFRERDWRYQRNMKINQNRLTTHKDVHHSLKHILTLSTSLRSARLDHHNSLLRQISFYQSCEESNVEEALCACQTLTKIEEYNQQSEKSVSTVVKIIQSIASRVQTVDCMMCATTKLHRVLRVHSYVNSIGLNFHVIALEMAPQSIVFESILQLDEADTRMETLWTPEIVSLRSISEEEVGIDCVKWTSDRPYCSCVIKENCSWV